MTATTVERRDDVARDRPPRADRAPVRRPLPTCDARAGSHGPAEGRCATVIPELIVELI